MLMLLRSGEEFCPGLLALGRDKKPKRTNLPAAYEGAEDAETAEAANVVFWGPRRLGLSRAIHARRESAAAS